VAFAQKLLTITFGLAANPTSGAQGTFSNGSSSMTAAGLRISAKVVTGGTSMPQLQAAIYGLPLAVMNELSTLGIIYNIVTRNTVTLQAGDADTGMTQVFTGNIVNCWFDGQDQPEVCMRLEAAGGLSAAATKVPVTSHPGPVPAATMLQNMAQQGGFQFENNGVQTKLVNPYFWGALRTQVMECIRAANCVGGIDNNGTLAIWPKNGSRQGNAIVISPTTGQVGYPAFANSRVIVTALFNSGLQWGRQVTIQGSQITPANGSWIIDQVVHDLESQTPNGKWFSTLEMHSPNLGGAVTPSGG
jgi:hypothetical protein